MQWKGLAALVLISGYACVAFPYGPFVFRFADPACSQIELCQIDFETWSIDAIGLVEGQDVKYVYPLALTFHPDGYLYAVVENGTAGLPIILMKIDPATAQTTVIGPIQAETRHSPDLAIDEKGDMWLQHDRDLYRVDLATGTAALECSQMGPDTHLAGLASVDGRLFTMRLWPDTPVSLDCNLNEACFYHDSGCWLASGYDNQLFLSDPSPDAWGFDEETRIYRVDPISGNTTLLGRFDGQYLYGLAFPPYQGQQLGPAIPTLNPWAAICFCVILAAVGALAIGRW